jgi:hypothetical protein
MLSSRQVMLIVILAVGALSRLCVVGAPKAVHFGVDISGNRVIAERDNFLTINVTNIGDDVYDVGLTLTLTPPLILAGDNNWYYSYLPAKSSVIIEILLRAPASAIKSTLDTTLTIRYKEIGYVYYGSEDHAIGFAVYGWIQIQDTDRLLEPNSTAPGSTITISGNILNIGNTAAMYSNISIRNSTELQLSGDSSIYAGEIDPNSPYPYSLSAVVTSDAIPGSYKLEVDMNYQDDQYVWHKYLITIPLEISARQATTSGKESPTISGLLLRNLPYVVAVSMIAILIVTALVVRRARKGSKPNPEMVSMKV